MIPISVFIITKNEEDRIEKVINAVKNFADEILIIDSGSVDKTVELSQSAGAQVYFNQWNGYGQQKIFGEQKCRNNWKKLLKMWRDLKLKLLINFALRSVLKN